MYIDIKNISKSFGQKLLFEDGTFYIEKGDRIGIVGENGAGKSTFLRIVAGLDTPDSGKVKTSKDLKISYFPAHNLPLKESTTALEYLQKEVDGILEDREHKIIQNLRISTLLELKVSDLSLGEQTKILLAIALINGQEAILLDEPTNNLDLQSLIWLREYLRGQSTILIFITHNQAFLEALANKIFEIDIRAKKINVINGSYSEYLVHSESIKNNQEIAHKKQNLKIDKLAVAIRQKNIDLHKGSKTGTDDNDKIVRGMWRDRAGKSGRDVKALKARIAQEELIEKPVDEKLLSLHVKQETKSAGNITLHDVDFGYEKEDPILEGISLEISFGEKILLLGENGAGKSTFLKTIGGLMEELGGEIRKEKAVNIGNFTQEYSSIQGNKSVGDFLTETYLLSKEAVYEQLALYHFDEGVYTQALDDLSLGERARVLLMTFNLKECNTLILDEPTNSLDLNTVKALEKFLETFKGTIILSTHDEHFLQTFPATEILSIKDKKLKRIQSVEDYVGQLKDEDIS